MSEKACKKCGLIVTGSSCPVCKSSSLSSDWSGVVIVLDPEESQIAKKLKITKPGKYAINIR